jgi:hypothetical protein
MNRAELLSNFLLRVTADGNLNTSHVSICTALCSAWIESGFNNPFNISRKNLMMAAKIKSTSTYHKIVNDLAVLKYFDYTPSYHPLKGSQVFILSM